MNTMKVTIYKILFKVTSFLTNKTGGMPLLVKYKIVLGTFLIGATGVSCIRQAPLGTASQNANSILVDTTEIDSYNRMATCYDSVMPMVFFKKRVVDQTNKPLENVIVTRKGDSTSVIHTNENGEFEIMAYRDEFLIFSKEGYLTVEVSLDSFPDEENIVLYDVMMETCYMVVMDNREIKD